MFAFQLNEWVPEFKKPEKISNTLFPFKSYTLISTKSELLICKSKLTLGLNGFGYIFLISKFKSWFKSEFDSSVSNSIVLQLSPGTKISLPF